MTPCRQQENSTSWSSLFSGNGNQSPVPIIPAQLMESKVPTGSMRFVATQDVQAWMLQRFPPARTSGLIVTTNGGWTYEPTVRVLGAPLTGSHWNPLVVGKSDIMNPCLSHTSSVTRLTLSFLHGLTGFQINVSNIMNLSTHSAEGLVEAAETTGTESTAYHWWEIVPENLQPTPKLHTVGDLDHVPHRRITLVSIPACGQTPLGIAMGVSEKFCRDACITVGSTVLFPVLEDTVAIVLNISNFPIDTVLVNPGSANTTAINAGDWSKSPSSTASGRGGRHSTRQAMFLYVLAVAAAVASMLA